MQVIKRNDTINKFDKNKITNAIIRAMEETEIGLDKDLAIKITDSVTEQLNKYKEKPKD